jgi:hypothetical protein
VFWLCLSGCIGATKYNACCGAKKRAALPMLPQCALQVKILCIAAAFMLLSPLWYNCDKAVSLSCSASCAALAI